MTSDEHEELVELRKENRVLREEREHLEACHSFLRQGDPVSVYPFIEAEKAEPEGNVAKACHLLEVSRSADHQWSSGTPSARELADAELAEKVVDIFTKSRHTYGAPRITIQLAELGIRVSKSERPASWSCVAWPGGPSAGSRRPPSPTRWRSRVRLT